ncbi:hypothetical protein BESB_055430 [Besnoitia besnoiti]|uniref:Transmembrane protein n=1 Tax=Besnoitia besnoiti TaxID=94643 RepID=A0A2A9MKF0_BESBE|nr:hypothetical protein BESB_055430 [Besnoitia besnoiti]PFH35892.1 hypothetical protein BESB_055430 [Besnoitia besnoiti]
MARYVSHSGRDVACFTAGRARPRKLLGLGLSELLVICFLVLIYALVCGHVAEPISPAPPDETANEGESETSGGSVSSLATEGGDAGDAAGSGVRQKGQAVLSQDEEEVEAFERQIFHRLYAAENAALQPQAIDALFEDRKSPRREYLMRLRPPLAGFLRATGILSLACILARGLLRTRNGLAFFFGAAWLAASYLISFVIDWRRSQEFAQVARELLDDRWAGRSTAEKKQLQQEFFHAVLKSKKPRLQATTLMAGIFLLLLCSSFARYPQWPLPDSPHHATETALNRHFLPLAALVLIGAGAIRLLKSISSRRQFQAQLRGKSRSGREQRTRHKERRAHASSDSVPLPSTPLEEPVSQTAPSV